MEHDFGQLRVASVAAAALGPLVESFVIQVVEQLRHGVAGIAQLVLVLAPRRRPTALPPFGTSARAAAIADCFAGHFSTVCCPGMQK